MINNNSILQHELCDEAVGFLQPSLFASLISVCAVLRVIILNAFAIVDPSPLNDHHYYNQRFLMLLLFSDIQA